jgi:hypothetical protein
VIDGKSSRPVSYTNAPDLEGLKACIRVTDDEKSHEWSQGLLRQEPVNTLLSGDSVGVTGK